MTRFPSETRENPLARVLTTLGIPPSLKNQGACRNFRVMVFPTTRHTCDLGQGRTVVSDEIP